MYGTKIDKSRLEKLVNAGAFLVDMRSPVAFRNGSIPGAVNLPLRNFLNTITNMDKSRGLILFSDELADDNITSGVRYAMQLGFTQIYISEFNTLK